jgi:outer membrane protein assembly factor BamD
MFKKRYFLIFSLSLIFVLSFTNCEYQKVKKSSDTKLKYTKAMEYYAKADYGRALTLLEDIMAIYKGTDEGQDVLFKYSYCNYYLKDFILAGYYFRKFAETYPTGKYTEEARYMGAYCYFLDAPKSKLDQTTTLKALQEFQFFISKYPNSSKMPECNDAIDKLRIRLEKKSYENAKLYLNIGYYNAAVISLKNSIIEFPDTQYYEQILFDILQAQYLYASQSITEKQKERYSEALSDYNELLKKYPTSQFLKPAEKIKKDTERKIAKL